MFIISVLFIIPGSTVGQVWFTAQNRDGVYTAPSPSGPLIFPDNISSLGPGFDDFTSVFTAPVRGLYFFTTTLRQNDADSYFYMLLNDVYLRYGQFDVATDYNTATLSTILMLEVGDRVHVEVIAGYQIECYYCNFDGYMLHEAI